VGVGVGCRGKKGDGKNMEVRSKWMEAEPVRPQSEATLSLTPSILTYKPDPGLRQEPMKTTTGVFLQSAD